MAQRPKVHYQATEDLLLVRLQFALAQNESLNNSLKSLSRKLNIPLQLVRICANRLEGNGYCTVETVEEFGEHPITGNEVSYNEDYLELTEAGIAEVESWPAEKYRQTAQRSDLNTGEYEFESDGDPLRDPLGASLDQGAAPSGGDHTQASEHHDEPELAPASDRLVTLDHNSAEYRETIAALSELSEEAKKSNEFGELFADPEDRVVILSQIDSGIQLLKNKKVIPAVVKRVLEYPVRFIKENMPGAALNALASKAWDWLMKLFENVI